MLDDYFRQYGLISIFAAMAVASSFRRRCTRQASHTDGSQDMRLATSSLPRCRFGSNSRGFARMAPTATLSATGARLSANGSRKDSATQRSLHLPGTCYGMTLIRMWSWSLSWPGTECAAPRRWTMRKSSKQYGPSNAPTGSIVRNPRAGSDYRVATRRIPREVLACLLYTSPSPRDS